MLFFRRNNKLVWQSIILGTKKGNIKANAAPVKPNIDIQYIQKQKKLIISADWVPYLLRVLFV